MPDKLTGKHVHQVGEVLNQEGAIWDPAEIIKDPRADEGAFFVMQGPLVPQEVGPDDPRLWGNKLK